MIQVEIVRDHLRSLLQGKNAHLTWEDAIKDFPRDDINKKDKNIPYSPWQLLEHMRIAQWDILQFVIDADHVSPEFPIGYWPPPDYQANWSDWENTVTQFRNDLDKLVGLLNDDSMDLYSDLEHAPGYTLLREMLLVADHNAYHVGGMVGLRRALNIWSSD